MRLPVVGVVCGVRLSLAKVSERACLVFIESLDYHLLDSVRNVLVVLADCVSTKSLARHQIVGQTKQI